MNHKHAGVKRLMREAIEMKEPTELYHASPVDDDNLFEWHFTVRGAPDTEFSEGVYHGRISFPPDYPMKPPSIFMLTKNGRFEVNKKICLSISGYHPETWLPSWSVRTALLAIIGFMPSKSEGAIGSLDYTPEERQKLAKYSIYFKCQKCGVHCGNILKQPDSDNDASKSALSEAKTLALKPFIPDTSKKSHETSTSSKGNADPQVDSEPKKDLENKALNNDEQEVVSSPLTSETASEISNSISSVTETSSSCRVVQRTQKSDVKDTVTDNNNTNGNLVQTQGVGSQSGGQPMSSTTQSNSNDSMALILTASLVLVAIIALVVRRTLKTFDIWQEL